MLAVELPWSWARPERPATNVAGTMGTVFWPIRNERAIHGHLHGPAVSQSAIATGDLPCWPWFN